MPMRRVQISEEKRKQASKKGWNNFQIHPDKTGHTGLDKMAIN